MIISDAIRTDFMREDLELPYFQVHAGTILLGATDAILRARKLKMARAHGLAQPTRLSHPFNYDGIRWCDLEKVCRRARLRSQRLICNDV